MAFYVRFANVGLAEHRLGHIERYYLLESSPSTLPNGCKDSPKAPGSPSFPLLYPHYIYQQHNNIKNLSR